MALYKYALPLNLPYKYRTKKISGNKTTEQSRAGEDNSMTILTTSSVLYICNISL